jgi:uncharacterized repeat protein (TIGR01451 family)
MKKLQFFNVTAALLAACLAWAALPLAVHAQGAGTIELKNVAEVEIETKDAQGKIERKRAPVTLAIPGTEVIYTTTFKNTGKKPAGSIVINNPIPNNTTLVAGSAFGSNTDITYSVDDKTFATPDKLKVKGKDGKEVMATTADYTAIRWTYRGELAAGKAAEAGFRIIIK